MLALTAAATVAMNAKRRTFWGRENASSSPAKRLTSQGPTTASSVFPVAMPSDVTTEPAVVTLTKKAPTRIAGQTREPKRSAAAIAIPVGGQTALALA